MTRDDEGTADETFVAREILEQWSIPEMPSDLKERVMAQVQQVFGPTMERVAPVAPRPAGRLNTAFAVFSVAAAAAALVLSLRRPEPVPEPAPARVVAAPLAPQPAATPPVVVAADPRVARGHLTLDVMPHDAEVDLDGVALPGPSPFVATNLAPGRHTLRVHRDGFTAWSRAIDVPEGQLHVPVQLVADAAEGSARPSVVRKPKSLARVESTAAVVEGEIDADRIREVVRANIGDVSACYEVGLQRDPLLAGKVTIVFVIGAKGAVQTSKVEGSTLADHSVAACIATAVKGWVFPAPRGKANVSVTYPFLLEPGD